MSHDEHNSKRKNCHPTVNKKLYKPWACVWGWCWTTKDEILNPKPTPTALFTRVIKGKIKIQNKD
jgi:hypothetical protein